MQAETVRIDEETRPGLPLHFASSGRQQVLVARPGQELYSQACALSAAEYRQHFQCGLHHFYPSYLCLERFGSIVAVCGYRSAAEPLFLEQYLDAAVETSIARGMGTEIDRTHIVEIGGFAVRRRALALPFMAALAPVFREKGFSHAVCTATLPVRRCLRALSIPTTHLGKAHRNRLLADTTDWGNYYQLRPAVIAGSIDAALHSIQGSLDA